MALADSLARAQPRLRRAVGPKRTDPLISIIEVWRMPGAGPTTPAVGGVGVDRFRMGVEDGADPSRPDQRRAKSAEYPARISRAGVGKEGEAGYQPVSINAFALVFNWDDDPDIRGGDRLLEKRLEWAPATGFSVDDIVQPTVSNGKFFICKTPGVTGSVEPIWSYPIYPAKTSNNIVDGTVVWAFGGKLRSFEVIDPGAGTTYKIVRVVRCEEIIS